MTRRTWLLSVVMLVAALLGTGAWMLLRVDPRAELERVLQQTFGRPVTIGALTVDAMDGRVELTGVELGNPRGWEGPPLLRADRVVFDATLDELLAGRVVGRLRATGLVVHIRKRGQQTNAQGLVARRTHGGLVHHLQLQVALEGARVILEDVAPTQDAFAKRVELTGVDLKLLLTNAGEQRHIAVEMNVAALELGTVALHNLRVRARAMPLGVHVDDLSVEIGQRGRVTGSGSVELVLDELGLTWQAELGVHDVDLKHGLLPWVGVLHPRALLVGELPDADALGRLHGKLLVQGRGWRWDQAIETFVAHGWLELRGLVFARDTLLVQLRALAGYGSQPVVVDSIRIDGDAAQGWASLGRLTFNGTSVPLPVRGRVSLLGQLDLHLDVGELDLGRVSLPMSVLWSPKVRIEGTVWAPKLDIDVFSGARTVASPQR